MKTFEQFLEENLRMGPTMARKPGVFVPKLAADPDKEKAEKEEAKKRFRKMGAAAWKAQGYEPEVIQHRTKHRVVDGMGIGESEEGDDLGPHTARIEDSKGKVYEKNFKSSAHLEKHLDRHPDHTFLAASQHQTEGVILEYQSKPLTTDTQRQEVATHQAFHNSIPHLDGESVHEHTHTHHSINSYGYVHAKHVPDVVKHFTDHGYSHKTTEATETHTTHEFKHPDGQVAHIYHEHSHPNDVEVATQSKLSPNASTGKTNPNGTKHARAAKQAAWNARYD